MAQTTASLAEQQKETEEQITASLDAVTEATERNVGNQVLLFENLSEAQQTAIENMQQSWADYLEKATDMFDTLSDESELTVSEMTNNLEENQRIIGEWSENIATLAERGVDQGLLETLRQAGPSSAGHVNALVNASDKELEKLSDSFSKGGEVATDALNTSLGIEESGIVDALGNLVTGTEQTLQQQIATADFESLGIAVPEGLGKGISKESQQAEKAAENLAKDVNHNAAVALGVNSPSKVFMEFGGFVAEGLAIGINKGTIKVMQAVSQMFRAVTQTTNRSFNDVLKTQDNAIRKMEISLRRLPQITQIAMRNMLMRLSHGGNLNVREMQNVSTRMVRAYNGLNSRFYSVGTNAMAGLNSGLHAGTGRVMSTARNIANNVARTMQRALRIHSPSRKMRDDVGKHIPSGLALGIRENAKLAYQEMQKLSKNMIKPVAPEVALGTHRMAYTSNTGDSISNAIKSMRLPEIQSSTQPQTSESIMVSDVIMDDHKLGKILWKHVKTNMQRDEDTKKLFRG